MNNKNFTLSLTVGKSAKDVFKAINNVRGWWSKIIEGETDTLGAVFYYHYRDIHRCTIKVNELVPAKKVVWYVLHNDFDFTKDKTEWNDTKIVFEITSKGKQTEIAFTHVGLTPAYECYEACSEGWGMYILTSLKSLIESGKGEPNEGRPKTRTEAKLSGRNEHR